MLLAGTAPRSIEGFVDGAFANNPAEDPDPVASPSRCLFSLARECILALVRSNVMVLGLGLGRWEGLFVAGAEGGGSEGGGAVLARGLAIDRVD